MIAKIPKAPSALEESMALQIRAMRLPEPLREYKFHPNRRWKADFAWVRENLLLEVEGGTWSGGRHTTGSGFEADCEKYAEALKLGWRVLRVTGKMVTSGKAIEYLQGLLK